MASFIDDDDDGQIERAIERDKKNLQERIEAAPEPAADPSATPVLEVDDEPEAAAAEPAEPPPTRREKRQERLRLLESAKEHERRSRDLEQQNQLMAMQLQQANMLLQQQQAQQASGPDPLEAEIQKAATDRDSLLKEYDLFVKDAERNGGKYDESKLADYRKRSDEVESRVQRARWNKWNQEQQAASQPRQLEAQAQAYLRMRYADIAADGRATQLAETRYKEALLLGQPAGEVTIDKVMRDVRKTLRMPDPSGRPAPSESEQRRYSGVPRGAANQSGESRTSGTITMTPERQDIAQRTYPHLKPREAYQKWVNGPGKKLLQAGHLR